MCHENMMCPYCKEPLERWEPGVWCDWDRDLFFCKNNECAYFVRGREKVCYEYDKNFAYRYCCDPKSGKAWPIVAWCGGELSLQKERCKKNPPL